MTDGRTERPTYDELCDKIAILEAENQELTERSEELLLIGRLGEDISAAVNERDLVERTLERLGLLKDLSVAALCELTAVGLELRYAYSANHHDAPTAIVTPSAVYERISTGSTTRLLAPDCAEVRLHFGNSETIDVPATLVTLPIATRARERFVLLLADATGDGKLTGSLVALERIADMLTTRIDNFRLLDELQDFNRSLDCLVAERTEELQRACLRLRDSEERFKRLVSAAGDAILVITSEGAVVEANPQACRNLGLELEQLLTQSLCDIEDASSPTDLPEVLAQLSNATLGTFAVTRTGRHRRADRSSFPVEVRFSILSRSSEAPRLLLIARDTTERTLLEQQLIQAQKMESVGRLAGGIAHDFNNMLTAILGYAEVLLAEDGSHREEISEIHSAARRAAQLTRQLLAFSRRQVLNRENVDLNQVVEDGCSMLKRIVGDTVTIQLELAAEPALVYADPVQLQQVLLNLVINARDAMPSGGPIVVAVGQTVVHDPADISEVGLERGAYATLTVSDRGVGMSEETRSHLFEPFFTTKAIGHGTGLGLATLHGIVTQHGGTTFVRSALGLGTTFRIFLPRSSQAARGPSPTESPEEPQKGVEHLLVVDDDQSVRQFLRTALSRLGYRISVASQGQEALELLTSGTSEPIALVLSDVLMPVMDGYELLARLEYLHPRLPVLLMSGFLAERLGASERAVRTVPIINKPISILELSTAIRRALSTAARDSLPPNSVAAPR